MEISQAAFDLIVDEEVSSQTTYERRYRHPEWPGGASGITIAIGYDLGFATRAKLHADFDGKISADMVATLEQCCGIHGESAHSLLSGVRSVDVPWTAAISVFEGRDLPEWTARVRAALPNTSRLSPDCLGALVSLAYNRGASFSMAGDRYREMRAIKEHMTAQEFGKIPAEFRSMKRLWNNGLGGRREREAKLFERGLLVPGAILPKAPSRTGDLKKNATAAGGGTGGSGTVIAASTPSHAIVILIAAVVLGAIIYFVASRHSRLGKSDPPTIV